MSGTTKVQRRRELRRQHHENIRKTLLITDYIRHKYTHIYSEAVEFYDRLNKKYSTKHDLRKTDQYKFWKTLITEGASHTNVETSPEIHSQARTTVSHQEQTPSRSKPRQGKHLYTDNLQLRIPLFQHKAPTSHSDETLQTATDEIHEILQTATDEILEEGQTTTDEIHETLQTATDEILEEGQTATVEIHKILQTATDEILEGDIQPSITQDIAPELIQKLIQDLRAIPDLADIFTDIEEQLEFEQLGMDLDINIDDNALDIELCRW